MSGTVMFSWSRKLTLLPSCVWFLTDASLSPFSSLQLFVEDGATGIVSSSSIIEFEIDLKLISCTGVEIIIFH